jgi:hypothetical protein
MRVANLSRILLLLALPAVPAACALAQEHPNVQPSTVRDQLMGQVPATQQAQTPTPKPAPAKPAKAPDVAKGSVQSPAKAKSEPKNAAGASSPVAKEPKTAPKGPAKPSAEKPAEGKVSVARRDPFNALLSKTQPGNLVPENLPPGKAGLMVGTLRIDGIVHGSGGMIAIVSNPQQRVYFLREGDKLYDGSVEHITLEAISFHEFGKDAFGKPLERQVTKRLYPSPGEQQ